MKKFIAVILAAAAAFTMGTAVFAEAEKTDDIETTITFDTEKAMEYIHVFGNADETKLDLTLTDENAFSGKALKMEESFDTELTTRYGGFYLDAADFGLESFAGYSITMSVFVTEAAAKKTNKLEMFSDGEEWRSKSVGTDDAGNWRVVTINVPANVNNNKVGLSIPIIEPFEGEVGMCDDIIIKDQYGKTLVNIGDIDNSLYEAPNGVVSVLTTILFILLIIAVILGVGYFLMKVLWAYR